MPISSSDVGIFVGDREILSGYRRKHQEKDRKESVQKREDLLSGSKTCQIVWAADAGLERMSETPKQRAATQGYGKERKLGIGASDTEIE